MVRWLGLVLTILKWYDTCMFVLNWKSKSLNPIIGYRVKMTLHVNPTCGQMAWPCPDDSKMVWHLVFGLMSLILYPKNVSDTKKVTAFIIQFDAYFFPSWIINSEVTKQQSHPWCADFISKLAIFSFLVDILPSLKMFNEKLFWKNILLPLLAL